jgi:exonuclease III
MFSGVWIINVYAPSGAEKRSEWEQFFNKNITCLLMTATNDIHLAGDFNCVISLSDCTGTPNVSRALQTLLKGLGLHDTCEAH